MRGRYIRIRDSTTTLSPDSERAKASQQPEEQRTIFRPELHLRPVTQEPKLQAQPCQQAHAAVSAYAEPEVNFVPLPDIDSWDIPVRCFKCNQPHVEPVRNFMIGNVIFCPHCNKSMVVRDNLNFHVRTLLKDSYDKWQNEQNEFQTKRERELTEFVEGRAKEAEAFEAHQQRELQKIRQQLDAMGETYDAPGKPIKKGSRFGWG